MFASALPKLAAALLQPPALAAGLVTGIVSGAVGVGTGAIPVTDPGPRLNTLYECPGSGRVVANLAPDQKVLVTARSADGAWLQIYVGEPGVERGWASAAKLHLAAAPDSLPIADCTPEPTPETSLELPSALPSPEATVVATVVPTAVPVTLPPGATPSPTPKPTATPKPTKTPTPTPTPFVGPTVSHLEINYADPQGGGVWYIYHGGLSCDPGQVTFSLVAIDPNASDGQVASAKLWYTPTGHAELSIDMYVEDAPTHVWQADVYPDMPDLWSYGPIMFRAQATDSDGHKSAVIYPTSEFQLELHTCP